MKHALTLIERYIIEAINNSQVSLLELNKTTGIEVHILQRILRNLFNKELLHIESDLYSLNLEQLGTYSDTKRIEISNIMKEVSLNTNYVSIKKVYLSANDQLRVKSMFEDIERFIEKKNNLSAPIKDKSILYWGEKNYGELINNYMN